MADLTLSQSLVALTPAEVGPAQQQIVDWCRVKMRALGKEYTELRANWVIAKRNRWGSRQVLEAGIRRTRQTIGYYRKIVAAVRAGYLVVPNFDVEVLAIRVGNDRPRWKQETYESYEVTRAEPQLLPPGEGRYVSEKTDVVDYTTKVSDGKGGTKDQRIVQRGDYIEDLPMPLTLLKPQVLEAAERALALKIFDRLGIVKGTKRSDPILVGQLIDPRERGGRIVRPKTISFFVAWWLDPATL